MISGSGWNTNPQNVLWFCHLCNAAFVLPAGQYHRCESTKLPKEKPDA